MCVHVCMYVCIYVCIYIYTYTYIYIYIGRGRIGKHRKHPGGCGNAGGH